MQHSRPPRWSGVRAAILSWLLVPLATLLLLCGSAELLLRFLPVNEGCHTVAVNSKQPYLHNEPNRTFTWSRFPDFSMRNTVHSNNLGFTNDQEYSTAPGQPVVAVIGDSMVEALMVPPPLTFHALLADQLRGKARVYSFGTSGAQLSQYLAYARYARELFSPKALIVVITDNDYDESFRDYSQAPGLHYFVKEDAGGYALKLFDFKPEWYRTVVRGSRLLMYLAVNVEVQKLADHLLPASHVAGTSADGSPEKTRGEARRLAARLFLDRIAEASGVQPSNILFVMDTLRPIPLLPEQAERAAHSPAGQLRSQFMEWAGERDMCVLDLQKLILDRREHSGEPIDYPRDRHWSPLGHALVAQGIRATGFLEQVLGL